MTVHGAEASVSVHSVCCNDFVRTFLDLEAREPPTMRKLKIRVGWVKSHPVIDLLPTLCYQARFPDRFTCRMVQIGQKPVFRDYMTPVGLTDFGPQRWAKDVVRWSAEQEFVAMINHLLSYNHKEWSSRLQAYRGGFTACSASITQIGATQVMLNHDLFPLGIEVNRLRHRPGQMRLGDVVLQRMLVDMSAAIGAPRI